MKQQFNNPRQQKRSLTPLLHDLSYEFLRNSFKNEKNLKFIGSAGIRGGFHSYLLSNSEAGGVLASKTHQYFFFTLVSALYS